MSRAQLLLLNRDGTGKDISELVQKVKLSGRNGTPSRKLSVTLLDDDGYGHDRAAVDVEEGNFCVFYWDSAELFRGMFMAESQSSRGNMTVTAYDAGIRLSNNRDTFTYTDKTAAQVFADVCRRFGIQTGAVADTGYRIPELIKPRTTGWDAIADALSLTYKARGVRYGVRVAGERVELFVRRENLVQWVLETGNNIIDYSRERSIEDIVTRLKLISGEGTVLAEERDTAIESKIGIFQDVSTPDETLNEGQLRELVKSMLAEKSKPQRSLSVTASGLADCVTGMGVYVIIPALSLSQTYYIEQDEHTFDGESHTMRLSLALATDTDISPGTGTAASTVVTAGGIASGDVVRFLGGNHYVSSTSGTPVGGTRTAGYARCTAVAKGAKHPYHLIGGAYTNVDGNSNVYGWVDEGSVSK